MKFVIDRLLNGLAFVKTHSLDNNIYYSSASNRFAIQFLVNNLN